MTNVNGVDKKRKPLTFVTGLLLVLLLISFGSIGWQRSYGRKALIRAITDQTRLISVHAATYIIRDDRVSAANMLNALNVPRSIVYCGVYDANDHVFTSYYRGGIQPDNIKPSKNPQASVYFEDSLVKVSEPVIYNDEVIGKVLVWSEI